MRYFFLLGCLIATAGGFLAFLSYLSHGDAYIGIVGVALIAVFWHFLSGADPERIERLEKEVDRLRMAQRRLEDEIANRASDLSRSPHDVTEAIRRNPRDN